MLRIVEFLFLLAIGTWVGTIIFFSFFAAPALFAGLDRELAGRAVTLIFPRYYWLGSACGAVALAAGVWLGMRRGAWPAGLVIQLLLLAVMLGGNLYAGLNLQGRVHEAKVRVEAAQQEAERAAHEASFRRLHRLSVQLNASVLVLGLVVSFLSAVVLRL